MDKIGADFFNCVRMIKDRTGAIPAPIALPIGAEDNLEGIIDLIKMEEWVWEGEDLGASWFRRPIRDDLKDLADEWRANLIEVAVEVDDDAMEKYLDGIEPDEATLRKLIRKGCLSLAFVPVTGRFRVQEQGRAAASERRDRLPAGPARRAALHGLQPGRRDRDPQHRAQAR